MEFLCILHSNFILDKFLNLVENVKIATRTFCKASQTFKNPPKQEIGNEDGAERVTQSRGNKLVRAQK